MQYVQRSTTRDYDFFSRPPNNYLNETFYILFIKSQFLSLFLWWEVRNNQPLQYTIGFMELTILGLQKGLCTFKLRL